MKKYLLSLSLIIATGIYAVSEHDTVTVVAPPTANADTGTPPINADPVSPPATARTNAAADPVQSMPMQTAAHMPMSMHSGYRDGTYTGTVADAYYGYVQVQTTIQGGKIASVQFIRYPNDRDTSRYINSQAMPLLKQEAVSAQSANVDIVSGATDTSMAFKQSLKSALGQANG